MSTEIVATPLTIKEFIELYKEKDNKKTKFVIPEYQRPYTWTISYCDKLWQDIKDIVDNSDADGNYFFGTIIVHNRECQSESQSKELELIDGQQRTTTFIILLKALLIRINEIIVKTPCTPEVENLIDQLQTRRRTIISILYKTDYDDVHKNPDDSDKVIYQTKCSEIYLNESNTEKFKEEIISILKSVTFNDVEKSVTKIKYRRNDNKYTNFFKNFRFFYEKAKEEGDINLSIFIKTLLEKCEVIQIKGQSEEQAINMFNSLNGDGQPLCDSDLIHAKLYASSKKQNQQAVFSEGWIELLNTIEPLDKKGICSIDSVLMQYMYYCRAKEALAKNEVVGNTTPALRKYFSSSVLINLPLKFCSDLRLLVCMWEAVSSLTEAKILFKFNQNSRLFLASFFLRYKDKKIEEIQDDLCCILESMLRLFTVLEIVDLGYSSGKFKSFLFKEYVKFVNTSISSEEIKKDFIDHINNNWVRSDIEDCLRKYRGNAVVYLNEFLFSKEHELFFDLQEHDVEHIMPQSGKNLDNIRQDAGLADMEEFFDYVDQLGNKILLESSINRSVGNAWFRTKISTSITQKTGYKDSKYPIALSLVNNYIDQPFWFKKDIEVATDKAVKRIADFIFGTETIKK